MPARCGRSDVLLYTSRAVAAGSDGADSLAIARKVSAALSRTVREALAAKPAWVIAKGGITSHDVARHGLGIRRAEVAGQLFPGVISVFRPIDAAPEAIGMPYVVFAGNVGDDGTLAQVVAILNGEAGGLLTRVGWLGLGAMGAPMATCLARSGHLVQAYDIAPERAAALAANGVQGADTIAAAVDGADAVAIMVATPDQVEHVLFAPGGAAGVLSSATVVMIMATIGPAAVVSAADRLAGRGVSVVDAPVSGGAARAAAGDLLIMVSGPASPVARVQPLLGALARSAPVVGSWPGDGQRMKLVNQLLCGVHIAAAAEALAFAEALGLEAADCWKVLREGAAASFMFDDRGARMVAGQFDQVRSAMDIFVKDMGLVAAAATRSAPRCRSLPPPASSTSARTNWAWAASTIPRLSRSCARAANTGARRSRSAGRALTPCGWAWGQGGRSAEQPLRCSRRRSRPSRNGSDTA